MPREGARSWGPLVLTSAVGASDPAVSPAALEWQGHKEPNRPVRVHLQPGQVRVVDGRLTTLRTVQLRPPQQIHLVLSSNRGRRTLLLKVPKEYDLVRAGGGRQGTTYLSYLVGSRHHCPAQGDFLSPLPQAGSAPCLSSKVLAGGVLQRPRLLPYPFISGPSEFWGY